MLNNLLFYLLMTLIMKTTVALKNVTKFYFKILSRSLVHLFPQNIKRFFRKLSAKSVIESGNIYQNKTWEKENMLGRA